MESRAKAAGHALHQQLVYFPLGLLGTAIVFDLIGVAVDSGRFTSASYLMVGAGVLTGLIASAAGFVDYYAIPPDTRAKRIALLHGVGNAVVLVLFGISWLLRIGVEDNVPGAAALALALVGAVLMAATGWLGGELVDRLGVGVDDDADLDARSKLTTGIALEQGTRRDAGDAGVDGRG